MPLKLRLILTALAVGAAVPAVAQPLPAPVANDVVVVPAPTTADVVVVPPPGPTEYIVVPPYPPAAPVPDPEADVKCRYVSDYWNCVNNFKGGG
jgi:hypothetical protein